MRLRSLAPLVTLVASPLAVGATGCTPTPAQRAEADMALVRRETNAATLVERGRGFATIGDHTRAEEYLAAALDAGADPREVLPLLMEVCVRTGRYRSAIQHGENHLRKHPHDLTTRVMVGALYTAINEAKPARTHLEHVVTRPEEATERANDPGGGDGAPGANTPPEEPTQAAAAPAASPPQPSGGSSSAVGPRRARGERLLAQAHYLLAVIARDMESDVVEADRHFREYLRIEPNGSHAEEANASLLKRMP